MIDERQFREIRDALSTLEPADIADIIETLPPESAVVAFRVLPRESSAACFAELASTAQESLLAELGTDRSARLVESMEPDDRAALLDELPIEIATKLIAMFSPVNRRVTQAILGYAPESVGRLITPDYVRVRRDWTVDRALGHIRRYGHNAETVDWVFVIDPEGRLIDDIHIRALLLAEPESLINDLMDEEFIALFAADDREEAVRMMHRYDRTTLPVVDKLGLLVGIVTADDVADVAEEEFTEDVQKLGGMEALATPYMTTKVMSMFHKRGGWLAMLLILQTLTITIMGFFEDQINKALVLAVFVPMVISTGGNTGSQAASLLVRAIAVEEVTLKSWWRVMNKEILTGLWLGATLGGLGMLVTWVLSFSGMVDTDYLMLLSATVGVALFIIVLWANIVGSTLPLVLDRLGIDPAAASTPFVATLMDVSGLTIYFLVAILILHGTIL